MELSNIKLSTKIWGIGGILGFVIVIIIGLSYWGLLHFNDLKLNPTQLNLAGAQRMLTQRITKNVESANAGKKTAFASLDTDMKRFNTVLTGLINGSEKLGLVPPPTSKIEEELAETEQKWREFEDQLITFREAQKKIIDADHYVGEHNVKLFNLANKAVTTMGRNEVAPDIIGVAGRLRALSQRIAKATFQVNAGNEKSLEELRKFSGLYEKMLNGLLEGSDGFRRVEDAESRRMLLHLKEEQAPFLEAVNTVIKGIPQKNAALKYIRNNNMALLQQMDAAVKVWDEYSTEGLQNVLADLKSSIKIQIGFGIVVGAIVFILTFFFIRQMTESMNRMIEQLKAGAEQAAAVSTQVSTSSQELAEGASEQATSLEETTSSLDEMASMTRKNAEGAEQANSLTEDTKQTAQMGVRQMEEMSKAIQEVDEASEQTSLIIKTIDDIAFQTNLLALNAAVEAARAGEAGKGFAVVAEEVRNLAQRSAEAAKETSEIIKTSRNSTQKSVEIVTQMERSLDEINQKTGQVNSLVSEITVASREQSQGIDQVNDAVSEMDQVTQGNAASAEEAASAAEELNAMTTTLQNSVQDLTRIVRGKDGSETGHSNNSPITKLGTEQKFNEHWEGIDTAEELIPFDEEEVGLEDF